ncbi:hypothetical protein PTSG_11241 [Salpingoeca rosetta]|uniref:EF-hand domain-containing protein n=1 Tax=Salpingoeca rosetta (strain ATCC 50818 / BSB-021) TaxID=946362 RepID=F2USU7_SALR5|nr:uncharacterized protein PTSG_11241 [Salpingoeca rosetta]EGD81206.1 hypothetical protein PTSG_11241 [Salpingoeca rosetta]|eukprot:XP_004987740.1 hypothetical protein PTSG_11241 [Salpingoeca rosetta]
MPLLSRIIFDAHDQDKSGNIDASELKAIVYKLGHPMSDEEIETSLRIIDKDQSGKITYDEFKKWWAQKDRFQVLKDEQENQKKAEEWAQWLQVTTDHFNYFDKDRNGAISREEFASLYDNLKQSYDLGSLDDALAELDANHDGSISLKEYVRWLRGRTGN